MNSSHYRTIQCWSVVTAILLLLFMLCFPFGYDQAVFAVGGEMIIKTGAIDYRDFLDTKPPVIFFIYGLSTCIFGHTEWAIRAFDILFHIGCMWYFYRIMRRMISDETIAVVTILLYVFIYVMSGFWSTAQTETFALLPSLVIFDRVELSKSGKRVVVNGVIVGLAGAILVFLKFTLVMVPVAALLYLLLSNRLKTQFFLGWIVGLSFPIGCYLVYLLTIGSFERFIEALIWLRGYSSLPNSHPNGLLTDFCSGLIGIFGLSGIIVGSIGATALVRDNRSMPYFHLALQFGCSLVAIFLEGKFFIYHYSRCLWTVVPFIAVGAVDLYHRAAIPMFSTLQRKSNRWSQYINRGLLCCILLFFSPTAHLHHQLRWLYCRLAGIDIASNYDVFRGNDYYYGDQKLAATYLQSRSSSIDRTFLWGNGVGLFFWQNTTPPTFCLTNTPFITAWSPLKWKTDLLDSLHRIVPRFFVCEFSDARPTVTANTLDSWQCLEQWSELRSFLEQSYTEDRTIGHFRIFERR